MVSSPSVSGSWGPYPPWIAPLCDCWHIIDGTCTEEEDDTSVGTPIGLNQISSSVGVQLRGTCQIHWDMALDIA